MSKWIPSLLLAMLAVSCTEDGFTPPPRNNNTNNGNNTVVPPGKAWGEACVETPDCRTGLVCVEGACGADGSVVEGQPCELTAQCQSGLYCNALTTVCETAGEIAEGAECGLPSDCASGLVCSPRGFSGECVAGGTKDIGASCGSTSECLPGLNCGISPLAPGDPPVCLAGPVGLAALWTGATCEADDGEFRAFFEVPDGESLSDFFRHPYPSDARVKDGRPVLTGFPTPGNGIIGFDVVQRYVDAIEATQDRFSPSGGVFLRFSKEVNLETLKGDGQPVRLVNIDADSPGYGSTAAFGWFASTGGNRYICPNYMVVRPAGGRPLAEDTTYAVILTNAVKDSAGAALKRDADFDAMLGDTRPAGALGDAWDTYAPLRAYLADANEMPPAAATVAFASVFTTGRPTNKMAAAVAASGAFTPAASDLTVCDTGVTSPCDDGLEGDAHVRGCFAADATLTEIHGKLNLPVFQTGDAPYLEAGGAASATKVRDEAVCVGITVPKGAAPANGWPVLLVAHGTGGNFRGHVTDLAPKFSTIDIDGTPVKFVTLGWDQVLHFTRRGDSDKHPNSLVYNYANPDAALGNFVQGGAEIASIVSWVASDPLTAETSPTGEAIPLDASQIWFLGHSQGGTTGPLALPFESRIRGAVLSGAGAGLVNALVGKTSPVNSPEALKVVLQESKVDANHPVVQLLQGYFDPVDPLNYARLMTWATTEATHPVHVFQTHGVTDTFTPPASLDTLAIALRATYIEPFIDPIGGLNSSPAPVSGNLNVEQVPYSVLGRQYQPNGYDGHFVLFRDAQALQNAADFLGTGVLTGVPEIR